MKKIITILTLVLVMSGVAFTQGNINGIKAQETITVNISDLDPALVQKIKAEQSLIEVKEKINTYGEWVGVGKEVGSAIDGGLTALTKHADNIANTNVGKFTMVMIAYKVLGEDIVGVLFGTMLFFIGTLIFCFAFYKNCINKVIKEVRYSDDGKTIINTKETMKYPEEGAQLLTTAAYFIFIGVCCLIMFAGS